VLHLVAGLQVAERKDMLLQLETLSHNHFDSGSQIRRPYIAQDVRLGSLIYRPLLLDLSHCDLYSCLVAFLLVGTC